MEAPGQVWVTEAECYPEEDGRQMLSVRNSYAVSEERRGYLNRYFSCPKFYSNIADKVGLFDVRYLSTSRKIIREYQIKKIHDLILSRRRTMPVCLVDVYKRQVQCLRSMQLLPEKRHPVPGTDRWWPDRSVQRQDCLLYTSRCV